MKPYRLVLFCLLSLIPWLSTAKPLNPQDVPPPLQPWVGWVLHGQEERACPFLYNDADDRHCVWGSRLELGLDEHAGHFTALWQVDAASWVVLPGSASLWPQQVELDGKPVAVVAQDGNPAVWLSPGAHRLSGHFVWDTLPESLPVPGNSGLISLSVNGKPVEPAFNDGALWLQGTSGPREAVANTLAVRVFRRIDDAVPLRVVTHVDLDVAGEQREVLLAGGLLPDAIPLELSSPLATRLEADGRLRVLLKPGRWFIDLTSRQPGAADALSMPPETAAPWPEEEIWSFTTHTETRAVEITGAQTVDPRQTDMPTGWKHLPAYHLLSGKTMMFKTLRHGDPDAAPDTLNLHRRLWLDFDGGGYTVRDEITGNLGNNWRLETLPGLTLGRVDVDGEPQLLTQAEGAAQAGVELRRRQVLLAADSRGAGGLSRLSATGWARDFHSVSAQLNLPPGWRLFAARGVDNAPGTWLGRWTLLDLFLVLIAALAVARLRGWPGGVLAAATLALLWHEPDAPRLVWLHLLAAIALLHVLPTGRIATAVLRYRQLAALVLVFIALPFMVEQVRTGVYPQLEQSVTVDRMMQKANVQQVATISPPPSSPALAAVPERPVYDEPEPQAELAPEERGMNTAGSAGEDAFGLRSRKGGKSLPAAKEKPKYAATPMSSLPASSSLPSTRDSASESMKPDPNALTQTGPGLPNWQWNTVNLSWNGPVLASQEISLFLLPPAVNLLLNLLRVALPVMLAWLLLGNGGSGGKFRWPTGIRSLLPLAVLALLAAPQAKAEMPSKELLDELQTRLLSPPECLPQCAQIASLRLTFTADSLAEHLQVHAQDAVAVPLPAQQGQWLPSKVSVDGVEATALFRSEEGVLWLGLKPGRHEVVLTGALPNRAQLQLPLALKPHRVDVEGDRFRVEGIKENGEPEGQLQLTRTLDKAQAQAAQALEARPLPPFLEVRRTLRLGLDWRVTTQVVRLSPADAPVVVEIPLLAGEAVSTPGLQVKNGQLAVSLAPGQRELGWESTLEQRPKLTLTAPQTTTWTDVWRADVSPVWHLDSSGIAPSRAVDEYGKRLPEWRPWPGESVNLQLTRPKGAPGTTLTLDSSRLRLSPGLRATDATLDLTLRSSQGGQHTVNLPQGAALQSASLNGQTLPVRQQGSAVTLPIRPGSQTFTLAWRQDAGITPWFTTPQLDLGLPGVNHAVSVDLGQDRWVLLARGPRLGPAVLFWGVLAVLVLVAVGLGRLDWTPLRTWQWFLLLLGLSQVELAVAACVVGWLFALGWRGRRGAELSDNRFNVTQLGLALFSLAALLCLFYAVQQGLLGLPCMQIGGNHSTAFNLNWYQDLSPRQPPQPWLLSVPLWVYRVLMLLWALWLANALLGWLRWGFGCFAAGGLWRGKIKA